MNKRYKVCPLFWSDYGDERTLMNMGVFEKLLNEGWQILRVDTMPTTEFQSGTTVSATNVYVLEKQNEEKQSEDTKKSSVSEFLPHDMGLRVELDTNETYYLKSGWTERCDGIYGIACGYASSGCEYYAGGLTWFEDPGRIAIMNSHVKLAVPFEDETETTEQSEDTNMKETNR